MNTVRRIFITTAALLALGSAQAQKAVKVDDAWARPTVAGQSGGGGFLKITGGAADDKLLSASAGISKAVELHKMEMDGNVMRMRPVDGIAVPAGATVALQPGGLHIMFIGLNKTLKNGDSFPMTLKFEKAGELKVDVKVMTARNEAPAAEHKH